MRHCACCSSRSTPRSSTSAGVDKSLVQDKCGAPLLTYSTAIYYNVKTFGDRVPQSCADFFDTKTYPGKRAVRSAALPNPLIECALIADGVKPDDLYPLDIDRAFKKIETISDNLVFWESDLGFRDPHGARRGRPDHGLERAGVRGDQCPGRSVRRWCR